MTIIIIPPPIKSQEGTRKEETILFKTLGL